MPTTPPVLVTVVHSPACHFCEDAQRVLAEFATEYPITVEPTSPCCRS